MKNNIANCRQASSRYKASFSPCSRSNCPAISRYPPRGQASQQREIALQNDGNKLILSAGIEGVIVYNWDGNSMNIIEDLRIHSSYAYTARFINEMYFIATKNGLEIYQLGG